MAAVHYSCATGYYSFAHELGHLFGLRHNPEVDGSTSPFAYGHGMIRPALSDRTVMAYNCSGGCARKPYWSGPNVMEGGSPFGDAAEQPHRGHRQQLPQPAASRRHRLCLGEQPSAASYAPHPSYTHNSSGGDITIARTGTGVYRVTFERLGGKGVAGGHVQVSAYGASNHYCKSAGWVSSGDHFQAMVRCFHPAGSAADTYYNIFVRWP